MQELLTVKNLNVVSHSSGECEALVRDVSFTISKGKTFALIGESGSGKSLTAFSIMRLLPEGLKITAGDVIFEDQNLFHLSEMQMGQLRGKRIGFIFQEPMTSLNPVMTAGRQIAESLYLHKRLRGKQAHVDSLRLLDDVGIPSPQRVFASYPHELSGGMKQRVAIAIALAGNPSLLIADEPTTALDVTVQAQILELLKELQCRFGMSLLFISHDLAVASDIADDIAVMQNGKLIEQAPQKNFFAEIKNEYSKNLLSMLPDIKKRKHSLCDAQKTFNTPQVDQEKCLKIKNLSVHFPIKAGLFKRTVDYVKAVNDVSFVLQRGKTFALVGESGSGKTTIAQVLVGLIKPTSGKLEYEIGQTHDDSIQSVGLDQFVRSTQMVFQDPFSSLNPKMPVGQAIAEGLLIRGLVNNKSQADEKVAHLLDEVGLPADYMRRYAHQLSGGQRQRICIARALSANPDFIIWDEPTSALDIPIQAQILDLFQRLQADYGLGYLLITHDISLVGYMADEVAVIHNGSFVEKGMAVEVLNHPSDQYTSDLFAAVPAIPQ